MEVREGRREGMGGMGVLTEDCYQDQEERFDHFVGLGVFLV
jgi:hypothetical protein